MRHLECGSESRTYSATLAEFCIIGMTITAEPNFVGADLGGKLGGNE